MKIAVTGPHGRLGRELVRRGCVPLDCNIADFEDVRRVIQEAKPDVVINCASVTNVDNCEHSPLNAAKVNTHGVMVLRQVFDGQIVQISTDYIFDGQSGPYFEDDRPNPINIYGWSKLGGEIILKGTDALIIRTTILFDERTNNFVTAVIKRIMDNQPVIVPDKLRGSPTYIPHLAKGILQAILQKQTGIMNIVGSRVMSRYQLALAIAERLGRGMVEAGPVTGEAMRPLKAGLCVSKAQLHGIPIYDPLEGLGEVIQNVIRIKA